LNKPKIYIGRKISKEVEEYIAQYFDYEKWEGDESISYEQIIEQLQDKDGLMALGTKIDDNLLDYAPNLKVVSNMSVGYNNFDIKAMKARGIIGTNVAGSLDDTVADLIFGLIISTARRIPELDRFVKDLKWEEENDEPHYGQDVHHASLGIIGMGRIGQAVAKRAKLGFDMDVYYNNRNRKLDVEESLGVKYLEFNSLLQTCDYIVLMTPLNKETYHLMDEEQFNLMKSNAIFINASRGQTVNEKALVAALVNRKILAAGLDVYEVEPIEKDNPLLKLPNVITLPHIGSATQKTTNNMAMTAAKNLVQALYGKEIDNIVPELM